MEHSEIERTLRRCEEALGRGENLDLSAAGFWKAVAAIKRQPEAVERFAERVAAIDRAAFEQWAWLKVSVPVGTTVMTAGTLAGLGLVGAAYALPSPWNGLVLLAATGALETTTHGLAHLVVGRLGGMWFSHWFVAGLGRPQPGVKLDYASYLRAPARRRAWMHASGAMVTKLVPFIMLGPALAMQAPGWTVAALAALGVGQVVTDALWSVRSSDWKKFRREMAAAADTPLTRS